jgi:uncharacterized protein (DUF433 family)
MDRDYDGSTMNVPAELREVVSVDPNVVSGAPVFKGTRVPVRALLDHLEAGDPLETFLDGFPSVSRTQAVRFIELAGEAALIALARPA